jgi:hypothetical protein
MRRGRLEDLSFTLLVAAPAALTIIIESNNIAIEMVTILFLIFVFNFNCIFSIIPSFFRYIFTTVVLLFCIMSMIRIRTIVAIIFKDLQLLSYLYDNYASYANISIFIKYNKISDDYFMFNLFIRHYF